MAAAKKTSTKDEIGDPEVNEVEESRHDHEPPEGWGGDEPVEGNTTIEKRVNEVILLMRGLSAKVDRQRLLSVCDLADRGVHHGREYRQLFVQADPMAMTVRLVQTVKSAHGGSTKSETVAGFVVPVTEVNAYHRLHRRFFGYNEETNSLNGERLVDSLRQTVA